MGNKLQEAEVSKDGSKVNEIMMSIVLLAHFTDTKITYQIPISSHRTTRHCSFYE